MEDEWYCEFCVKLLLLHVNVVSASFVPNFKRVRRERVDWKLIEDWESWWCTDDWQMFVWFRIAHPCKDPPLFEVVVKSQNVNQYTNLFCINFQWGSIILHSLIAICIYPWVKIWIYPWVKIWMTNLLLRLHEGEKVV